jgi:sugar (pentulose or hexulose) kinase
MAPTNSPHMDDRFYIGIDLGTTNIKAALYDQALQRVVSSSLPTQNPAASQAGQVDPAWLKSTVLRALHNCVKAMPKGKLNSIGISGMAEAGCLIDRRNEAASSILLWYDRRGTRQAKEIRLRAGPRILALTGLPMNNVRSLAKWRWFADQRDVTGLRWCGVPEWVGLQLTGQLATEPTLAVRTGAFDVRAGVYSSEILALAGAPLELFPPIKPSPARLGRMLPQIAREIQLPSAPEVYIAGHDDIVASYGANIQFADLVDSAGTAEGLVRITSEQPTPSRLTRARLALTPFYYPHTWALIGGPGSTGALIEMVARELGKSADELEAMPTPTGHYPPGTLQVSLSQAHLPTIKTNPQATTGEIWSATLDQVVARFGRVEKRFSPFCIPAQRLVILGGGSRSPELSRRKSELTGMPAVRLPHIDAATRGAAALAGFPIGEQPEIIPAHL